MENVSTELVALRLDGDPEGVLLLVVVVFE